MRTHRRDTTGRRDGLRPRRLLGLIVAVVVAAIVAHGGLDLTAPASPHTSPSVALHVQPCPEDTPGHVTGACPGEAPRVAPAAEPAAPTLARMIVRPVDDADAPAIAAPAHLRPRLAQLAVYRT
ncbi:hypothetical protein ACQEUV_05660 [Micromonospora aurantiaca (nom. illeg.)]|uniref:hypothetical protein n=1 Tax=Micromonospora aurantiaca (nom. illeg.) TaxID=47850 RepID=UPI003DA54A1D